MNFTDAQFGRKVKELLTYCWFIKITISKKISNNPSIAANRNMSAHTNNESNYFARGV